MKAFDTGRRQVNVLKDISFHVEKGEIIALKGKSGSGKTTLLNCCCGLESPDSGKVVCSGIDLKALTAKQLSKLLRTKTGFVFQQGNLLSYLTVSENISFPLHLNNETSARIKLRVSELLSIIGMKDAQNALPSELSGGETLRVAVARALSHKPEMLFADEPTASLDTATGKSVLSLIRDLSRMQKSTVVFSTHDPELLSMADLVFELKDGELSY
ncbi:MAG: ABC transporter ATP-binding protein [Proteobacteria bacterium]|nr:ABC transporter ATP-binding protein [Pseudomonadota bacterium]